MAVTKTNLSALANGKNKKITATASLGTGIHQSTDNIDEWDELWLWATNTSGSTVKLTIEFGGTTSPDDLIEVDIPPESGLVSVVPGLILQVNSDTRAFADTADVINVNGYVNRYS